MRKLPIIFFMAFYIMGTLLCPMGDLAYTKNLSQVYDQCKDEDPDINAFDFVFEHLLNLESVFEHFENDADEGKNEKPHHPFQLMQSVSPVFVVVSKPLQIEARLVAIVNEERSYSICQDDFVPSAFLTEVFHPPSA